MVNIPKRITPCPIANATVEFRFATDWDVERLREEVYSRVNNQYPEFEGLPIRQIPQEILEQENALRYLPSYQSTASSFVLRLGARVLSVTTQAPYDGWNTFRPKCLEIWDIMNQLSAVQEIERLGLRYTNVFDDSNIFNKTHISPTFTVELPSFAQQTSYFRTFLRRDTFDCLLQVSNELTDPQKQCVVSLIDIDVSLEKPHLHNNTIIEALDSAHIIEKELFFGLLKPDFLNTLNPEY